MYFTTRLVVCDANKPSQAAPAVEGKHHMITTHDNVDQNDRGLERLLRRSRGLVAASEPLIQRAMAIFRRSRRAQIGPTFLQRTLAVLTFDSGAASPSAFGMRSAGGSARQMLFSADSRDVDLRVIPAEESCAIAAGREWILAGQVLGPDAEGLVILTDSTGIEAAAVPLNDLGEFCLPAMAPGVYHLTLRLGHVEIILPAVRVPPSAWPCAATTRCNVR